MSKTSEKNEDDIDTKSFKDDDEEEEEEDEDVEEEMTTKVTERIQVLGSVVQMRENGAKVVTTMVLFGSKHLYVVHHPQDLAKNPKKEKEVSEEKPTYSKAQEEIAANSGFEIKKGPNRSKDELLIQEDLVELIPHVSEANAMSEELKKRVRFEIALISPQARGAKHGRTEVSIMHEERRQAIMSFLGRQQVLTIRKVPHARDVSGTIQMCKDWDVEQVHDEDDIDDYNGGKLVVAVVVDGGGVWWWWCAAWHTVIEIENSLESAGLSMASSRVCFRSDIRSMQGDGSPLSHDEEFVDEPQGIGQKGLRD
eukprot:XP_011670474.1 PREDICTED: uncharacterized protein LOC105441244 [Strongylocentrotus purpuratus]